MFTGGSAFNIKAESLRLGDSTKEVLIKSTTSHAIMGALSRVTPYRIVFVLATSIRFIPLVVDFGPFTFEL